MDWIDATLITFEKNDRKKVDEFFAKKEFQFHFCLALLFPQRKNLTIQPSHILLTEPKSLPAFPAETEQPSRAFFIWFDIEEDTFLRPHLSLLAQKGKIKLSDRLQEFVLSLLHFCPGASSSRLRKKAIEKLLESVLYAVTSYVLEESPQNVGHIVVQKALNYMQMNVMRNLTLQELCHMIGVSQEYFIRLFKKEYNSPPMKYFAELRLYKSLTFLINGWSIHDIVCKMDFYNDSYYCKLFKNTFGVTPGKYRKKYIRYPQKHVSLSEQHLLITSHLLTEFIDTMEDFFFVKNANLVTIVCNQAYSQFVGLPIEEICGKTDFDLFSENTATFFRISDQLVIDSGKEKIFRNWVTYPDGRKCYMETRKSPYFGPSGNILGLVCLSRHLAPRKGRDEVVATVGEEDSPSDVTSPEQSL